MSIEFINAVEAAKILQCNVDTVRRLAARREAIAAFNARSPVAKRALASVPVMFGISFNMPSLNQGGALVHVYTDGSIQANHGGTEMGQGLYTKVAQVVAEPLAARE